MKKVIFFLTIAFAVFYFEFAWADKPHSCEIAMRIARHSAAEKHCGKFYFKHKNLTAIKDSLYAQCRKVSAKIKCAQVVKQGELYYCHGRLQTTPC